MKKLILLILIVIPITLSAKKYIPTKDVFLSFFESHTYVVLPTNPFSEYNITIEKAIKDNWNITEYTFIKETEFEMYRKDPKNSFIILTQDTFENDKIPASYYFINIMIGKDVKSIDEMPYVFAFPLKYTKAENELYIPFINTLVLFMQKHLNNIKENPDKLLKADMFKMYNENSYQIKSSPLFMPINFLTDEVDSEEKISAIYTHKFKICQNDDLRDLPNDKTFYMLYKVGPEECKLKAKVFKYVFDNKGNMFYSASHTYKSNAGDGFLLKDMQRINK